MIINYQRNYLRLLKIGFIFFKTSISKYQTNKYPGDEDDENNKTDKNINQIKIYIFIN